MASATVVSSAIVLEVLNQHNYNDWSSRVQTYLLAEGLWDLVNSAKPGPESRKGKAEMSDEAWKTMDAKALHAIKISCGTEIFSFIQKVRTAQKAWKVLENKFKSSDIVRLQKKGDEKNPIHKPFFDCVVNGDWGNAKKCLETLHPDAKIPKTALHTAVMNGRASIVKELVLMMSIEDLKEKDGKGRTALGCTVVASDDDDDDDDEGDLIRNEADLIQMATYMVDRNKDILSIGIPPYYYLPVVTACGRSKWEMARYFYSVTPPDSLLRQNGIQGAQLIITCFRRLNGLDIARSLLQECPRLAVAQNIFGDHPMLVLAGMRNAFLSRNRLTIWQKLIYHSIHIQPICLNILDSCINVSKSKDDQVNQRDVICSVMSFFRRIIKDVLKHLGIIHIYEMKSTHVQVYEILSCMGEMTRNMKNPTPAELNVVRNSIFKAIEQGHVEFITHMCKANPVLMDILDEKSKNIFQYAIECRQEGIYNLIYGLKNKKRKKIGHFVAKFNNNMLHSVANLSPITRFNHIQDASLQMQRELQWFKEVKNIVPIEKHEYINSSDGLTAHELFTKNHMKLKEEARISIKGTATSCTTVGALIVTIMFAVAFTVPGGTNGSTGLPMFMHKKLFRIFIVSDTISLVFSATSVITFLGILTSRYAEDDFLMSLPTKMLVGLLSLFISIAAMMTAFSCALTIMLDGEACIIIPSILLACVPIISFVWFLFPLLVEICISTYGPGIFDRKIKPWC